MEISFEKVGGQMKEQLQCGAGKMKITPREEWLKDLRGLQDIEFTGILDDLYVRALLFDDGCEKSLIVTFDLDKVPHPGLLLQTLEQRFQIPEQNIILTSIHTHTAPVTGIRINEGPNDISKKPRQVQEATAGYEAFITECMMEAVGRAVAGKRPARLTYGSGECCINVDRIQDYYVKDGNGHVTAECGLGINPGKAVDRTMFVLKVDGPEGDTIGFFLNYPMHNCVMIQNPCGRDGKPAVSSDVGGAVCRYLEEAYGGSVALWTSGAAGDINPVMGNEIYYPDIKTGRQTRLILKNGEMARAALKNLSARQYADVCQVIRHLPSYKENTELHGRIDWIRIPSEDSEGRPMDTPYEVRMHLLKIGDLALIGASGELYSSLGTALKAASDAGETIIINHDCSLMVPSGYIFDDETLERDIRRSLPGRKSCFMARGYIRPALEESCRRLEKGLFTKEAPVKGTSVKETSAKEEST